MATAKLATLLVRTLAKPIATQLKAQAAQHESFRRVCVTVAQTMHKSEMALRYNLLPRAPSIHGEEEGGKEREKPKVRPLNEAKAIANGANFLSEAFLFAIAAGLIIGESWRSSNKNRQQRNRTEERVEEVRQAVSNLCLKMNVSPAEVGLGSIAAEEGEETEGASGASGSSSASDEKDIEAQRDTSRRAAAMQHRHKTEEELRRLQSAVDVLLRMAIKSGWIQGPEALDLSAILDGKDNGHARRDIEGTGGSSANPHQVGQQPATPPSSESDPASSPILSEVASARARHLASISRIHPAPSSAGLNQ